MPTIPPLNFPGSATPAGTIRALKKAQQDNTANLTDLEGVINERSNGERININVATFESVSRISQVRDDLKIIDVSTPEGAADAARVDSSYTRVGGNTKTFEIFIEDELKEVQIFARKTPRTNT